MNIYFLNNTFLIAQFLSAIFLLVVFIYAIFQASKVVNLSLLMLENEYLDTSNMATAYVSLAGSMFVFFCGAFAQAIMFIPISVSGFVSQDAEPSWFIREFSNFAGFWYNFVFALMIIVFTYFYTAITVNTNQMADDMKRNGGFVPGIKPGKETSEYLDSVMTKIVFPGSLFLAFLSIIPAFAKIF